MKLLFQFSCWWCALVLPLVNLPGGVGYGPNSERLPGFKQQLFRVLHAVLAAVLFDWVALLRNFSFSTLREKK